jgi:hypothetical protein
MRKFNPSSARPLSNNDFSAALSGARRSPAPPGESRSLDGERGEFRDFVLAKI